MLSRQPEFSANQPKNLVQPMMFYMKFDHDWPADFRDIHVHL